MTAEASTRMSDDHDHGLQHDLGQILTRRRALTLLAATAAATSAGCDQLPFVTRAEAEQSAIGPDGQNCVVHPSETAGPFPADGSNRAHGTLANVLRESGIVRQDMRPTLRRGGPVAEGAALRLSIVLTGVGRSCVPLSGHAIYVWHCDAAGRYSIYDLRDADYLRAVGVGDAQGRVDFTTIVPGCYQGRTPHMHFEIYPSLDKATDYRNRILTSQLAVPADICKVVYGRHPVYGQSVANLERSPLERDMVFRDNTPKQLAAQTLSVSLPADGSYAASVTIGVSVSGA